MNLGNKIQDFRKQKNVTQEELAAELGVTAAAISKWENGYTLPDVFMLCALADFFAVTTDELLGRAKEVQYAMIAAATPELGKKAEALAKNYGIKSRGIYADYEAASAAASADDSVGYLISCFFSGFYGEDGSIVNLVSVAPAEDEILEGLQRVFDKYLKN